MTRRSLLGALLAALVSVSRGPVPAVPEYLRRGAPLTPERPNLRPRRT